MKTNLKKVLSLVLAFVMVVTTMTSISITVGAAPADEKITIAAEADDGIATVAIKDGTYAEGEEIDFGVTGAKVYAAAALTGNGNLVQGNASNTVYPNSPDGAEVVGRLVLKIVPEVEGNVQITSGASNKQGYILRDTGTTADVSGTALPVFDVVTHDTDAAVLIGHLLPGNTYYVAYRGTNAKVSAVEYKAGTEIVTEAEQTTESTTEAYTVNLENINDIERKPQGKAGDGTEHTIWILGDSTGCYYGTDSAYSIPRNGYGMAFGPDSNSGTETAYGIFDGSKVKIQNLAISGISSKSFKANEWYTKMTTGWKEGDYVFIGFGHNDEKNDDSTRFTSATLGAEGWNTTGQFAYSLYSDYILPAVKAGVTPVLVTPIVRRSTSATGPGASQTHNPSGLGDYRQTLIDLAKKFNLSCIDNTYNTYQEHIALGAGSDTEHNGYCQYHAIYTNNTPDNTHLNADGARMVAYFFAQTMLGNEIKFGVTPAAPDKADVTSPLLTTCGSSNTDGALTNLATFLGPDAQVDPRGKTFEGNTIKPTDFAVKLGYTGDASKIQAGDSFNISAEVVNVPDDGPVDTVDLTFAYPPEQATPDTSKPVTDAEGNVLVSAEDYAKAVASQISQTVKGTNCKVVRLHVELTDAPATVADEEVTPKLAASFEIPFKLVKRGDVAVYLISSVVSKAAGSGDVDGDGKITSNDAAMIYANLSDTSKLTEADVTADSVVDATDAVEIMNKVLRASYNYKGSTYEGNKNDDLGINTDKDIA